MAEIANAYIALTVKAPGIKKGIEAELGSADAEGAGRGLGDRLGVGISSRTAAIAGAVGGIVATVANQAISGISALVGDAVAASDATDKFKKTLSFAGLDTGAIDRLSKSTREYADETVYSLSDVQSITAQLASNGVKDYDKLGAALGNLNAIAGGSAETYGRVGMVLTQTAGAGKLTTENWNQLAEAIPGASGALMGALEESGAYVGNFRDAMSKGEITAEEFNAALLTVGTDPIAVEAAKSTETMEGAVGNLSATITGALSDAFTEIKPLLTDIVNGLAGAVSWVKDNVSWLGPLATGIAIVAGAIGIWTAVQWLLNVAMTANPIGLIVLAIGLLIGAIILLVQNWDAVVAWISDVWGGFIGWITDGLNWFVGWWNGLWAGIWNWIVSVWEGIVSWVTDIFNQWLAGMKLIGDGISSWWNGLWDGVIGFFTDAWNNIMAVVKTVSDVFGTVFGTIGDIIEGAFNTVVDVVKGVINGIIDLVNGAIGGINDIVNAVGGALGFSVTLGKIPRLAEGGIVPQRTGGTLAVVGEGKYDEAVIPLGGSQFDALAEALGKRIGDGEHTSSDPSDVFIDKLARSIAKYTRVEGRMGVV